VRARIVYPLIFLILCLDNLQAQDHYTDSLEKTIPGAAKDTTLVSTLYSLCGNYIDIDLRKALEYGIRSRNLAREIDDKHGEARALNNLGLVYERMGNYEAASQNFFESLRIREETGDTADLGRVYNSIGIVFDIQGNFGKAREYYLRSLAYATQQQDENARANTIMNLGIVDVEEKNYPGAMRRYREAQAIFLREKDSLSLSDILSNIGQLHEEQQQFDSAAYYYKASLDLRTRMQDSVGMAMSMNNLASALLNLGKYKEAETYFLEAIGIAKIFNALPRLRFSYAGLAELYDSTRDYRNAYRFHKLFKSAEDSLFSLHSREAVALSELRYLSDKKQKEDEIRAKAKAREQLLIVIFLVVIILVVSVFSIFLFNRFRLIRKQKNVIEEKNREIFDSITYAQRLQEAILPPLKMVKSYFPESFIFYKPKDIISGDFYWIEPSPDNAKIFFAVADCTGHGVPGAMVSVVCSNALNRAVKEFNLDDPGKILDKVTELVLQTFEKSEEAVKDGMDISLCCMNAEKTRLWFSGANNSLWIGRGGEIQIITSDSQPVGKYDHLKPFTSHAVDILPGDWLFLGSDGYSDQFGGEKGKKFKTANLRKLLAANSTRGAAQQLEILKTTFEKWKGELEQVDDVCVLGIRVG
jgi:serine phosphatase RsbU (regulator of sigma subunit)/tetratricopeptide (TPR) repeat protein